MKLLSKWFARVGRRTNGGDSGGVMPIKRPRTKDDDEDENENWDSRLALMR
jgi:hypothetical protein